MNRLRDLRPETMYPGGEQADNEPMYENKKPEKQDKPPVRPPKGLNGPTAKDNVTQQQQPPPATSVPNQDAVPPYGAQPAPYGMQPYPPGVQPVTYPLYPGYPAGPGYPPGPGAYYPPAPQQQQQQQQSTVIVNNAATPAVTDVIPFQSFTCHIMLACCVMWCCGCLFGVVALGLARELTVSHYTLYITLK